MAQHRQIPRKKWPQKRRSRRLILSFPVVAYRLPKAGRPFFERAHTLAVSAHGALVSLATGVAANQILILEHALTGEEQECRVISTRKRLRGPAEVGIEFREPAPDFWGIEFPPRDWKNFRAQ